MWTKLAIAGLMATASVCTAQSELPDNAADARKLRDAVIAWSQHLPDENGDPIDPAVLAPVADYLDGQQWPDPGINKRARRMWGSANEGPDTDLSNLEHGASWLAKAFEVDRPEFAEQLATVDGAGGVSDLYWMGFEENADTAEFDVERWSKEWHDFLRDTSYLDRVWGYSRYVYTQHINSGHGGARAMARLLAWLIPRSFEQGDADAALNQVRSLLIISRSCTFSGTLGSLTSHAIERLCWGRLLQDVESRSDSELARIAELQRQASAEHYLTQLLTAHIMRLNAWGASGSPDWEGYEDVSKGAIRTVMGERDAVHQEIMGILRAELDLFKAGIEGDHAAAKVAQLKLVGWDARGQGALAMMNPKNVLIAAIGFHGELPTIPESFQASRLTWAVDRAMHIVVALHRHKLAHGKFPESLELLVPQFLDRLPMDPFDPDRGTLRYRFDSDGFTLWSVGPDGEDNHGEADPERPHDPGEGFDLILWPTD